MPLMFRSSQTNTLQLSAIHRDSLCWKSFLWSAVLRCSFVTFFLALYQFFDPVWVLRSYCFLDKAFWNRAQAPFVYLDPSGVPDLQETFLIPKDCKVLKPHVSGQDIRYGDFFYRMDLVDDSLHPKGDFVVVTLPVNVAFFREVPDGHKPENVFPAGSTIRTFPTFGSLVHGSPSLQGKGKGCCLYVWWYTGCRSA